jgi:hypothetical protein
MWLELPVLLATRLGQVVRVVFGTENDLMLRIREQEIGDIDRKRRIAAFVAARVRPVDPHPSGVIDRPEHEEYPLPALRRGNLDGASVPARAEESLETDSAQQRLRREGDEDRSIPGDLAGERPVAVRIESEIPASIERFPIWSLQLRSRVSFRHAGHACSFIAIAGRRDRPGARRDTSAIVSTGEPRTSEDSHISAYVRIA